MRLHVRRDHSKADGKKSDDDDDDEDDDDDKDSDFDDVTADKKPPPQSDRRIYTVLSEFKVEQEGDLSVQVRVITGRPCVFCVILSEICPDPVREETS